MDGKHAYDNHPEHPGYVGGVRCTSPHGAVPNSTPSAATVADWNRFTWTNGYMNPQMPPVLPPKTWEHKDGRAKKPIHIPKYAKDWQTDMRFMHHACCKKLMCNEHIPAAAVLAARKAAYVDAPSLVDRRMTLLAYMQAPYTFGHRRVCVTWLKLAMLVSNNGLYHRAAGENMPHIRNAQKADSVCTWLAEYSKSFEFQPDRVEEIHLTVPSRKWVWLTYQYETKHTLDPEGREVYMPVTLQYFRDVWKKRMPHIKVLKYQRFTMCNVCTMLRFKKSQTRDSTLLADYNKELRDHICFVRTERAAYQSRINQAITDPDQYLSIVQDGSSAACYAIPHLLINTKDQEGAARLKVPFVATTVHGLCKMFYLVPEHIKKDSTYPLNCCSALWLM